MIQISVFWTIIFVVIVYAGIQHLLNWGFRKTIDENDNSLTFLLVMAEIIITVACGGLIYTILQNQL